MDAALESFGPLFGGATAFPQAKGVWRDDEMGGVLVKDQPVVLHCYTTPADISDPDRLRAVVLAGGLAIEHVEDVPVTWAAESLDEWWETTRDTSRMLTSLLERLSSDQIAALRVGAEAHLQEYLAEDGSLAVPGVARVIVATVPA